MAACHSVSTESLQHLSSTQSTLLLNMLVRPIPINTKKLFCCLSSVIHLGSDCYTRTLTYLKDCVVETKQNRTKTQSYKMYTLLPVTEATLMFVYFL